MTNVSPIAPEALTESTLLPLLMGQQCPLAAWRLPGSSKTHLITADGYEELNADDLLEELEAGFIFAPYDRNKKRLFIPAQQLFIFEDGEYKPPSSPAEHAGRQWLATAKEQPAPPRTVNAAPAATTDREHFVNIVQAAIDAINTGAFEKVVPSRVKTISLPPDFDVVAAFQKLASRYPEALISYVSIPGLGQWLGASPEVLINVQDRRYFRTVALAGTQAWEPGIDPRKVSWTQKEIEEQALVARYIISCFKSVRLREYEEQGPKTVVAGNLMHLKSEFTVDMEATNFPLIGSVMLGLLHPTSAVCGMPLQAAQDFLARYEGYDRKFYAGYLGPVNVYNNIELFVNLRCMQVCGSTGIFYAGAGVTADSDPAKEWAETEMKLNTLLNIIL